MNHVEHPSNEAVNTYEDPVVAGADEHLNGSTTPTIEPTGAGSVLSSSSQPGRGLPDEIIDLILAQSVLKPADHGRCAFVSRSFGKVAHDKLYDNAFIFISHTDPADARSLGDVCAKPVDEWQRLARPNVRASVRALRIGFIVEYDVDDPNDASLQLPGIKLGCGALARLVAELPLLVDLHLASTYGEKPNKLDFGDLKGLRRLSMDRLHQAIVASAPNLDRLITELDPETEFAPAVPQLRHLRKLRITSIDSRLVLDALVARLEWLAPPSLEVLEMPLASTSAALLLPFLERHVSREHQLREVVLRGGMHTPCWAAGDREALRKLGQEHGFRASGPGL